MNHIALFNGVGGFCLAAQWMGWNNVASCEIDPFCNKVTGYYWPQMKQHGDIKTTDFTIYRGTVDILTGGFPCQPFSMAGKRKGTADDRHLWPEMLRAIREIQPRYVVGENVPGFVNWDGGMVFEQVLSDLEGEGYEVQPIIIPACAVNAPHRRDRIWIVANNENFGRKGRRENCRSGRTNGVGLQNEQRRYNEIRGEYKRFGDERPTTNTRLFGQAQHEQQTAGIEQCDKGDVADTSSSGRIQDNEQFEASQLKYAIPGWDNFPTQSPVRSRNDGILYGLVFDSISEARHRRESIKAYGNAICPQVAYQIFKSIALCQ